VNSEKKNEADLMSSEETNKKQAGLGNQRKMSSLEKTRGAFSRSILSRGNWRAFWTLSVMQAKISSRQKTARGISLFAFALVCGAIIAQAMAPDMVKSANARTDALETVIPAINSLSEAATEAETKAWIGAQSEQKPFRVLPTADEEFVASCAPQPCSIKIAPLDWTKPKSVAIQGPIPPMLATMLVAHGVRIDVAPERANFEKFVETDEKSGMGIQATRIREQATDSAATMAETAAGGGATPEIGVKIVVDKAHATPFGAVWLERAARAFQREESMAKLREKGLSEKDLAATPVVVEATKSGPASAQADKATTAQLTAWIQDGITRIGMCLWLEVASMIGLGAGFAWWTRSENGSLSYWRQTPLPAWVMGLFLPTSAALMAGALGASAAVFADVILLALGKPIDWSLIAFLPIGMALTALLVGAGEIVALTLFSHRLLRGLASGMFGLVIISAPLRNTLGGMPEYHGQSASALTDLQVSNTMSAWSLGSALFTHAPWSVKLSAVGLCMLIVAAMALAIHWAIGRFERLALQKSGR